MNTSFCISIPFLQLKRMRPQQLHTENASSNCCSIEKPVFKVDYNMGKYRWLCQSLLMCHIIILKVNIITRLLWYYCPWCQYISTYKRGSRQPQRHWKMFLFQWTKTAQLTGLKGYDKNMMIYSATSTADVSLAQ